MCVEGISELELEHMLRAPGREQARDGTASVTNAGRERRDRQMKAFQGDAGAKKLTSDVGEWTPAERKGWSV